MLADYVDYFNIAEEAFLDYSSNIIRGSRGFPWIYLCMTIEDDADNIKELILDFVSGGMEIIKLSSIPVNVKNKLLNIIGNVDLLIFKNELEVSEINDLEEKIKLLIKALEIKKISYNTRWFFFYDELKVKVEKKLENETGLSGDKLLVKLEKSYYSITDPFEKLLMNISVLEYCCKHNIDIDKSSVVSIIEYAEKISEEIIDNYMEIEEKKDYFVRIEKLKKCYDYLNNTSFYIMKIKGKGTRK